MGSLDILNDSEMDLPKLKGQHTLYSQTNNKSMSFKTKKTWSKPWKHGKTCFASKRDTSLVS